MREVERKTYTMKEAARILGVSWMTIRRCVQEGSFPHIRIGKRIMIPAEFVDELLEKWRKVASPSGEHQEGNGAR